MNGNLIFGSEAESAFIAGEEGCAATFKRSMGSNDSYCIIDGKSYSSTDLSALLLRHLKEDAERELNDTIDSAVITVPAYFYSAEREATIRAAEIAGLKVKKIIDEPNAAAMAYGLFLLILNFSCHAAAFLAGPAARFYFEESGKTRRHSAGK